MASNLNLIDWPYVAFSSLWILGFSLILAGLSFHYWLSIESEEKFWDILGRRPFQLLLWAGLSLISVGFTGVNQIGWEFVAWGLLSLGSIYQLFSTWRSG